MLMSSPDTALAIELARARDLVERATRLQRRLVVRLEGLIDAAYLVTGDLPAAEAMPEDRLTAHAGAEQERAR